jgi:hypothetical protein
MPFGHDVVAEAGCIGIFAILINTLYLKKTNMKKISIKCKVNWEAYKEMVAAS